jgi:hypothetical protein
LNGNAYCVMLCCKHVTFFLTVIGTHSWELPWVSEETLNLDYWTILGLVRLEMDGMHFCIEMNMSLWGFRGRVLYLRYEMFPQLGPSWWHSLGRLQKHL